MLQKINFHFLDLKKKFFIHNYTYNENYKIKLFNKTNNNIIYNQLENTKKINLDDPMHSQR